MDHIDRMHQHLSRLAEGIDLNDPALLYRAKMEAEADALDAADAGEAVPDDVRTLAALLVRRANRDHNLDQSITAIRPTYTEIIIPAPYITDVSERLEWASRRLYGELRADDPQPVTERIEGYTVWIVGPCVNPITIESIARGALGIYASATGPSRFFIAPERAKK